MQVTTAVWFRQVRNSVLSVGLALAHACAKAPPTHDSADSASVNSVDSLVMNAPIPATWPAEREPQCADDVDVFDCYALKVEKPLLARTGIRVRRSGDTLRLNTNDRSLVWIDSGMRGEGSARHFYAGTITTSPGKGYAVVRHALYEDSPYVLVDWASGDTTRVPDLPLVSPDSNRIVAGAFSEDGLLELEIWNLRSKAPTREFARKWDGAGPVNIAWRDNRTIDFALRQTSGGRDSVPAPTPMLLQREPDSTWRLGPAGR